MGLQRLGQYKLLSRLGSGGTGTVYKAQQETLGRLVAVKVLHPNYSKDPELLKRFKREIEISASLNHPNLVKVYDAGAEGDFFYFSMEFVQGEPLRERMRGGKQTAPKDAGKLLTQVLSALTYVHARNIVHRDLKPENIMIEADGVVKLMDFGIVKVTDQTVITQEGATLGTPRYMSPEMVMGEKIDTRSDIFQMGVILYEMVVGKCPFDGASISEIAARICDEPYAAPSTIVSGLPMGFDALIASCLAKTPEARYQTAEEVSDAIAQLQARPSAGVMRPKPMRTPRPVTSPAPSLNSGATTPPILVANRTQVATTQTPAHLSNPLGRTMADIKDWLTTTTSRMRAMNRKRAASAGGVALGLAVLLGVTVHAFLGHSSAPMGPPTIVEGARGFLAHWETSRPENTELEVSDLNAPGAPQRFAAEDQKAVTAHSITVPGLAAGTDYQAQIVLLDGTRSSPARVTISGATRLTASEPAVRLDGTTLEVSATTAMPARSQARVVRGGKESTRPLSEDWSTRHVLRLEAIDPDETIERIELGFTGVDLKDQLALGPYFGPRRVASDLLATLATLKEADVDAIGDELKKELEQARKLSHQGGGREHGVAVSIAHPRQTFIDWLKNKGLWESLVALRPVAGAVFGAGPVPLDDQLKLYARLAPVENLDSLGYSYTTASLLDIAGLTAPLVRTSYPDHLGQGTTVADLTGGGVLSLMSRRYAQMLPTTRSPDGKYLRLSAPMGIGDLPGAMSAEYLPGTTSEFTVDAADLGPDSRATLLTQVANFGLDTLFEITVNGQCALRLRNDPAHFKGFDVHALVYTNVAMIEQKSNIIALDIPAHLFRPGGNVVEIHADGLPGLGLAPGAQLLRMILRFNKPGP